MTAGILFLGFVVAGLGGAFWLRALGVPTRHVHWLPLAPVAGGTFGAAVGRLLAMTGGGPAPRMEMFLGAYLGFAAGIPAFVILLTLVALRGRRRQRIHLRSLVANADLPAPLEATFATRAELESALDEVDEHLDVRYLPARPERDGEELIVENLRELEADDAAQSFVMIPQRGFVRRLRSPEFVMVEPWNPFAAVLVDIERRRIAAVSEEDFCSEVMTVVDATRVRT